MTTVAYNASRAVVGTTFLSGPDPAVEPAGTLEFSRTTVLRGVEPDEVLSFCLQMENFAAVMPDKIFLTWASSDVGEYLGTYVFRWYLKNVIPVTWAAFVDDYQPGRQFSDLQVRGIFRHFRHTHLCEPDPAGTRYSDIIRFATVLGPRIDRLVTRRQLADTFAKRHRNMLRLLDRPQG